MSASSSDQAFEMGCRKTPVTPVFPKLHIFHSQMCSGERRGFANLVKLALKFATVTGRVGVVCNAQVWTIVQELLFTEDVAKLQHIDWSTPKHDPELFWDRCARVDYVVSELRHFIGECEKEVFRKAFGESLCKFFLHGRNKATPFRFDLDPAHKLCIKAAEALLANAWQYGIFQMHALPTLPQIITPAEIMEKDDCRWSRLWGDRQALYNREILGREN
jgi:hypothetical protein